VSFDAIQTITTWPKDVCKQSTCPELPIPNGLEDALKLRLTSHTLNMKRHVSSIDKCYVDGLAECVPSVQKIDLLIELTRKNDDPLRVALANRISCLRRCHKVTPEE
jgi:hypothetical protein